MARFKVGDSPRSMIPIGNHHCSGDTWYRPEDVGVPERVLRVDYPFLEWDAPATEEPKKIQVPSPKKKSKRKK